jgi:hypothetical protein
MIISASSRRGTEKDIPKYTVGIVFLGTPHRGSASSSWGSLIVQSGKVLGLDGEDRILNDLKKDSEPLQQVVILLGGFLTTLYRRYASMNSI